MLFKHELGYFIKQMNLLQFLPISKRVQKAKLKKLNTQPHVIKSIFEELGGTFIKFGQFLSLREDLLPKQYCEEFKKLQDDVPPAPFAETKKIIAEDLNGSIDKFYSHFDNKPIAAASVGQVFEAQTKNHEHVAVKVQRPNIKDIMDIDLDILEHLAILLDKHVNQDMIDPVKIVNELKRYTSSELDYQKEAKNINLIRNNFSKITHVKIPKVYWKLSSKRVLTLEFIKGKKLSDISQLPLERRKIIVERIVSAMFKQVFLDGIFHADPHPGNILVLANDDIAFLDFGIVGYLDEETKLNVTNLFISLVRADLESIFTGLIDMDVIDTEIDINEFKTDLMNNLARYYSSKLEDVSISEVFSVLIMVARKYHLKLPPNMVLLAKSVITIEGIAKKYNPDFNFIESAKPFLKRIFADRMKPQYLAKRFLKTSNDLKKFMVDLPKRSSELMMLMKDGDRGVRTIEYDLRSLTGELERSSTKVLLGLLITAFIIGSALVYTVEQGTLFGFPILSFIGFSASIIMLLLLFWVHWKEQRYIQI